MRAARCARCRLVEAACICAAIPTLEVPVSLTLFIHRLEVDRPSNSGWLLARMLPDSRVIVHGRGREALAYEAPERSLLLHPDGRRLTRADRGAALLVADGTWSQARRMTQRIPALRKAEAVSVAGVATVPRLRRERRVERMCTAEAVARALGCLGEREAEAAMLRCLSSWAERNLALRHG